ncbi:MAG: hypothetical protein SCARUB_04594 [Candidatus Scalindua rubra]|uniref:Uncharacterized protein n=1 Tax=Candidatus Scalindua rubra TaxID=1872076 RepID=A0A1E3X5S7_9BACT|nr:MAG: hypothetical protein SCARUB_04594 [Candidatus Scalindua rubra]
MDFGFVSNFDIRIYASAFRLNLRLTAAPASPARPIPRRAMIVGSKKTIDKQEVLWYCSHNNLEIL